MRKIILFVCYFFSSLLFAYPTRFVYLKNIDPTIIQDMRYSGFHNFVGRPIHGYEAPTCILTEPTAIALKKVQQELKGKGLSLKVYDCYRPVSAVNDFMIWSKNPADQKMKTEFYPRVEKNKLFESGYIAEKSGHSRGSTVDLTIVDLHHLAEPNYSPANHLVSCFAPYAQRFHDNSIDMGSGYDCMDRIAHIDNHDISKQAQANRQLLRQVMIKNGFAPYAKEWWHFTLKDEPYKNCYFSFNVR